MNGERKKEVEALLKSKDVFVTMKGNPEFPQCGFSAKVVEILNSFSLDFGYLNIFEDEAMMQDIKDYTNWPTTPQIFVKGEFVGGCDILIQMYNSGDLKRKLEDTGILK